MYVHVHSHVTYVADYRHLRQLITLKMSYIGLCCVALSTKSLRSMYFMCTGTCNMYTYMHIHIHVINDIYMYMYTHTHKYVHCPKLYHPLYVSAALECTCCYHSDMLGAGEWTLSPGITMWHNCIVSTDVHMYKLIVVLMQ